MARRRPRARGIDVSATVLADSTSMRMSELLHQNKVDFKRRFRVPAQELQARLIATVGDGLIGEDALAVLEQHLRACEDKMQAILSHTRGSSGSISHDA